MSEGMKYIAYDRPFSYQTILIFAADIDHATAANQMHIDTDDIISAGFIKWFDTGPECYGQSTSLKKKARPKLDTELLKRQMRIE